MGGHSPTTSIYLYIYIYIYINICIAISSTIASQVTARIDSGPFGSPMKKGIIEKLAKFVQKHRLTDRDALRKIVRD